MIRFLKVGNFIVGLLFIFSGLIKINDPYGFAYKLKEYFEVFSADFSPLFEVFSPHALLLAVLIAALEIVLGAALIINYQIKKTAWVLLALILFFTLLTFYSAYFNKVKECGCFGNVISITPWQSFSKDLILLGYLLILFFYREKIFSYLSNLFGNIIVGVTAIICLFLGYYSILHLPFVDFGAYAKGKNIAEQLKPEEDPKFIYIMEKGGKRYELEKYPTDPSFKYVNFKILNPEKSQPKIMDYRIWNDEGDFTDSSLTGTKLFIIVREAEKALSDKKMLQHGEKISKLADQAQKLGIKPIVLTSSPAEQMEDFRHEIQLATPYYFMDDTQLKTMIRSDLGLILVKNGTIKGKWHHNDIPDADQLKKLAD